MLHFSLLHSVNLVGLGNGEFSLGCGGTNCDYMNNCVYEDGSSVLVYGTVVYGDGWSIVVDEHCLDPNVTSVEDTDKCEDLSDEFMLPGTNWCMMVLGIGVHNGTCAYISGCSPNGHEFFTSMQECQLTCRPNKKEHTAVSISVDDQSFDTNMTNAIDMEIDSNTTEMEPVGTSTPMNQAYGGRTTLMLLVNCFLLLLFFV